MSEGRQLFPAEPIAYILTLLCVGFAAIGLVLFLGVIMLPFVIIAAGGYYGFRYYRLQKMRVQFPEPTRTFFELAPVGAPITPRYNPDRFAEKLHKKVLSYLEKDTGRISCAALSEAFTEVVSQLYAEESFHEQPSPPESRDLINRAAYQDKLDAWQKKTADEAGYEIFMKIATESYLELRTYFPEAAFKESRQSSFTVPLSIPMTPDQVAELAAWFFVKDAREINLFEKIRDRINVNTNSTEEAKLTLTFERCFGGTPMELFSAVNVSFDIPDSRMMEHCVIVAGAGTGKTQTLGALICSYLERDDPPAMVVIDSTGALVKKIQTLALFNDRLKERIVIIDPEHTPVPALNMFDTSNPRLQGYSDAMRAAIETEIVTLFNYIFTSAQNDLTSRQGTVFSYVVRLVLSIPNSNVHTLLTVLEENTKSLATSKFKSYIERLDPTTQDFFKNQYFDLKGFRDQIAQRVYSLIQVPAFRDMFTTTNKIDFYDELQNKGAIILVNTSEMLLKGDASPLFGRYIIARTMASAFERAAIPEERRRPTLLIIDECAPYVDDTFDKLLTRLRQFKLGVCAAFQHMEQVSEKLRSAIASNTSVKLAAGLGYADSRWLARDMETTPEFLKAQRRDSADPPQWTQLACYVRNFTPQAVSITVPFYALEKMPQMTPAEHRSLLERNRARVSSQPKPTVEAEAKRNAVESAQSPTTPTSNDEKAPPSPSAPRRSDDSASNWG